MSLDFLAIVKNISGKNMLQLHFYVEVYSEDCDVVRKKHIEYEYDTEYLFERGIYIDISELFRTFHFICHQYA